MSREYEQILLSIEEAGSHPSEKDRYAIYGYAKAMWKLEAITHEELFSVEQKLGLEEEEVEALAL